MVKMFVFGSNLAGRHGKGAALYARQNCGAIYGQASGPQGDSYAIPTKDSNLKTLPLEKIKEYIDEFLDFAAANSGIHFDLSKIGCGLAGYNWEKDIRPLFPEVMPKNIEVLDG